jgi:hypothetical protein
MSNTKQLKNEPSLKIYYVNGVWHLNSSIYHFQILINIIWSALFILFPSIKVEKGLIFNVWKYGSKSLLTWPLADNN